MKPRAGGPVLSGVSLPATTTPPSTAARPEPLAEDTMDVTAPALEGKTSIQPGDTLGQFSYGPATQTTVVTTTTTTTTQFPPLMLRAPKHLRDLDPKLYPLAASPTPKSIKKLSFEVDGKPTTFEEADDTLEAIEKVRIFW